MRLLLTIVCMLASALSMSGQTAHNINLTIVDSRTKEPIMMGTVMLKETVTGAVTDLNGRATIRNVQEGNYTLTVNYVGYQTLQVPVTVGKKDVTLRLNLVETSLRLNEVSVTARQNAAGTSTASIIGRQAIDHLQATSLADVMQLVPGQLMGNGDLISSQNLQLRQLVNNNTSAFGASIVVDGVPMSNNAEMSHGAFNNAGTSFSTDLRQIAADDIEEVEVVRGIPSAEYGDLTSGLVVVHSKVGVTPLQIKAKINPTLMNYSAGKGLRAGRAGVFNFNLDYAQAWGDPRMKSRSFHRYTASAGWGYDINSSWHTDTKFRFVQARDWNGNDPDAQADNSEEKNRNQTFALTHNGKIQVDKFFSRNVSYTLGVSLTQVDHRNTEPKAVSSGFLPIITARETGYFEVPYETRSYIATGITESRPGNVYAKVSNQFYLKNEKTRHTFKMGAEYRLDWNSGKGYYNENERYPLQPNSDGRPRAYNDIPALHQVSAYAEDMFTWDLNDVNKFRATAGVRFTSLQPFSNVATTALSPRLNMSFSLTKWADLRAGVGMNSKTPGLGYLYPDKKYADVVALKYQSGATYLPVYHTQVYDVAYSRNMKNATTTKFEAGIDFKLPNSKKLSILAYHDKTPNGFGSVTDFVTYQSSTFNTYNDYVNNVAASTNTYFMTTGEIGNTNTTVNRGFEIDFDFGTVKPLYTSFFLSGAYQGTKTWNTDMNTASVKAALLPTSYSSLGLTPFKIIYPSGEDYSKYSRMVTTLRTVTHIPQLRMVFSITAQAIWHNWNRSYVSDKNPIGWIGTDCQRHEITSDMMGGYLGMDGKYYATQPTGQASVALSDLTTKESDNEASKEPFTWNLQLRLTKELGKMGSLSFYVNNALYYEPFLSNNKSKTLSQRNTGFSFGAELSISL